MSKAKFKDRLVFYSINPKLRIWRADDVSGFNAYFLSDETWYGGEFFNSGVFIEIPYVKIRIRFFWWYLSLAPGKFKRFICEKLFRM